MNALSWLIVWINDTVLRGMFLAPRNTLGMRDGVTSLLAGHLDRGWRTRLPMVAMNGTFHALTLARRLDQYGLWRSRGAIRQSHEIDRERE